MEFKDSVFKTESLEKQNLYKACIQGDLKYIGEFIVAGGDLTSMINESNGQTPLYYCIQRKDLEHIAIELNSNKNENIFEQYDRLNCARVIIKSNPEFLNHKDYAGLNPLHLATINGDLDFILLLIDFRVNLGSKTSKVDHTNNQIQSVYGRTILHLAVIHVNLKLLDYYLDHIYMIEILNEPDSEGGTALHYAIQLNNDVIKDIITLLIKKGKANLNSSDNHGRTPLIWAATIGSECAINLLLQFGANLMSKDLYGLTAIHCAASRGHLKIIQSILHWIKVANADDPNRIASFLDVSDNDGCTALFYSVTTINLKVTKCLIQAKTNVTHKDSKGRTVCHCLARLVPTLNDEHLKEVIKLQLKYLMQAGLNPWEPNKTGATALHEACLLKNVFFIKLLSTLPHFNKVVNKLDLQGYTVLSLLMTTTWSTEPIGIYLCSFLLKHGAHVNSITGLSNGQNVTALDLAQMNPSLNESGKRELVSILVKENGKTYDQLSIKSINSKINIPLNVKINIPTDSENSSILSNLQINDEPGESNEIIIGNNDKIGADESKLTLPNANSNVCIQTDKSKIKRNVKEYGMQTAEIEQRPTVKIEKQFPNSKSTQTKNVLPSVEFTTQTMSENAPGGQCVDKQIVVQIPPTDTQFFGKPLSQNEIIYCEYSKHSLPAKNKNKNQKLNKPNLELVPNKLSNQRPTNIPLTCTLKNLEHELPVFVRQFDKVNNQYHTNIFHRNSRCVILKSTKSPYLQPVIPNLNLKSPKQNKYLEIKNKTRKQETVSLTLSPTTSRSRTKQEPNRLNSLSSNHEIEYKLYELLSQLLKQKNLIQSIKQSKNIKLRTYQQPEVVQHEEMEILEKHSAMGGELTPTGVKTDEANNENNDNNHQNGKRSSPISVGLERQNFHILNYTDRKKK